MGGKEGRGDAGQHQTREHRGRQHILLDALAACGFGGAKDDALHAVVDAPACLEGIRVRGGGEVVEVRLEEPEGLHNVTNSHGRMSRSREPTRSAPLTDSSHKSMMNSSKAIDSLSMLIRRW